MKKILLLLLVFMLVLTGCGLSLDNKSNNDGFEQDRVTHRPLKKEENKVTSELKPIAKEDLFVGFIFVGETSDLGFTYAHNNARLGLEADGIKTAYVANVAEDESSVTTAAEQLISQGCNVIYANSFGHGEYLYKVAEKNPGVYFGHATGYQTANNFSNFMGRIYEARYLAGIVAGMQTKTNKIGYVAAKPIAEVVRGINAFALGVKSVNPDAKIEVKWTNTWYDVTLEKQCALSLIDAGCDVMAQHCDSAAPQVAAEERGIKAIGYNCATPDKTQNTYLTAPIFHWDVFYKADIQAIIDGTWKSQSYWTGLSTGMVSLDTITDNCENKDAVVAAVNAAEEKIKSGELVIFKGPFTDNTGVVRYDGETMTDAQLTSSDFNWLMDNVIGSVSTAG